MTYKPFNKKDKIIENKKNKYPVRKYKLTESFDFLTTIILSHFNRSNLLIKAIDSILKCSFEISKFRILLIDDGSMETDIDPIIKQYENLNNFEYVLLQKNIGNEAVIKNIGVHLAQNSKYICFMDSDDEIISKTIFDKSITALENKKSMLSTLSNIIYRIEIPVEQLPPEQHWILKNEKLPSALFENPIYEYRRRNNFYHTTLLQSMTYAPDGVRVHRRSIWLALGGSLEDAVHGEAAFYLRMHGFKKDAILHINDNAYLYRIHNLGQLTNITKKQKKTLLDERIILLSFMVKYNLTLNDVHHLAKAEHNYGFFEKYQFTDKEIAEAKADFINKKFIQIRY